MLNRRHLLQGLGGLATAPLFLRSIAAEAASANDTIVVAIMLQGGNDGLNTVIPLKQYGAYRTLRTPGPPPNASLALAYTEAQLAATAFDANPSTAAAQASEFAFNPAMGPMRGLYARNKLAVLTGVGLPLAEIGSLNHGTAEQDWQTGLINQGAGDPPGWLGMALSGVPAGSLGPTASFAGSSLLLTTATSQALTIWPPLENFQSYTSTTDNWTALTSAASAIMALPTTSAAAAFDQGVIQTAHADIGTVQAIAKAEPVADYPTQKTYLGQQLREIARLILGGSGIRGYFAGQGSYDSHSAQATTQPALLADLSRSMETFYLYLKARGASRNVVIMTMSDFGRRPQANANFGTDHGAASVNFVLGDRVKGGVYGHYPSLTKLDPNGNLAVGVDFRNLISDVIQGMGGNPTPILGMTYPKLGFI
jgi:uncharacterized protein (DUF1501 family)